MGLFQKIESDMRRALKAGEPVKLSVLRMLISAIRMFEIDGGAKPEDTDIFQIIQKQVKQRKESITQFEKGNRRDLADKEKEELKVLESYMPDQLSEEGITAIVKEAINESGAITKREVGKVMKIALDKVKGRADGKAVNQIAMKLLK